MKASHLFRVGLSAAMFFPLAQTGSQPTGLPHRIAITHVTLIDVSRGISRPDMTVTVASVILERSQLSPTKPWR
jgi:hypothetical protein